MKTFRDDVRAVAAQLSDGRAREKALALYADQETLDAVLEQDAGRYRRAAKVAGATAENPASEEVGLASRQYESGVRLSGAAAELGMTKLELRQRLERSPKLAGRGLQPLLVENDGIQREIWEGEYRNVVVALGLSAPVVVTGRRHPASRNITRAAFVANDPSPNFVAPARDEAFATARKLQIWSRSKFFNRAALERKIIASHGMQAMGITVVESAAKPDLFIRLDRPLLTFGFVYTVTDALTKAVVMSGKVTAINDEAASDEIVKKLEARLAAARAFDAGQPAISRGRR
jgi:hypothetical protein